MVNEKRREARESFVILFVLFSWLFLSYFLFCFNVNVCESISQLLEIIAVFW